ncbi:MAG: hypothetical protein JW793_13605, partial [Acidobacteria bacterium]|nr:hypothetical protein [Acidobacteriota bacterium]
PSPARTAAGSVERPGAAGTGENRIPAGADTAAPEETIILATEGSAGAASRKEPLPGTRAHEPEYREYRAIGPDNLPLIIPLPDRFHMQITPPPEEYFIRNVSH